MTVLHLKSPRDGLPVPPPASEQPRSARLALVSQSFGRRMGGRAEVLADTQVKMPALAEHDGQIAVKPSDLVRRFRALHFVGRPFDQRAEADALQPSRISK